MIKAKWHLEDQVKLRELVLYLCRKSEGDEKFGSIKLNKLLFFSDFGSYSAHQASITGSEYQNLINGPAPRQMKPLLDDMVKTGEIQMLDRAYYGRTQKRPYATREPNLALFTSEEIAMVDAVIERLRPFNGTEVSELSHQFSGWRLTKMGHSIPYASVRLDESPLSQTDKDYADALDIPGVEELLAPHA